MIERFNSRIDDIIKTTPFRSTGDLRKTPLTCVDEYIKFIPRKALGHKAPLEKLHPIGNSATGSR